MFRYSFVSADLSTWLIYRGHLGLAAWCGFFTLYVCIDLVEDTDKTQGSAEPLTNFCLWIFTSIHYCHILYVDVQ